jgi:hypothetical protein
VSSEAEFRAVLSQHPIGVGEGYYAGQVLCEGCHLCLGNPTEHLVKALAEALDPSYRPPGSPVRPETRRDDPRESQIVWTASEAAS